MEEKKEIKLTQSDFEKTKKAEKSHSGTGLKVVCGVLALAVLGLGGFIVYDKFFAAQPEKAETSASNQTLVEEKDKVAENNTYIYNTDEQELYDLIAKYDPDGACGSGLEFSQQFDTESFLLSSGSTDLDKVEKKDLAWVIFWNAVFKHEHLTKYDDTHSSLTKDELVSMKNELYGKKFNFDVTKMHTLADEWQWDSNKELLYFQGGWGGACPVVFINTKITKAQKTKDKIEIFIRKISQDGKGLYKYENNKKKYFKASDLKAHVEVSYFDAKSGENVNGCWLEDQGVMCTDKNNKPYYASSDYYTFDTVFFASDWRKGNLYKITFEQDSDNSKNYIFKSSEILE